ncbi:hypothetical protein BH23PSE1_BH23PSE1_12830 [soil metagenome]
MNAPVKQHLIDPEICIRCHTCEAMKEAGIEDPRTSRRCAPSG